ncbi:AvrD family protein [Actinosynnema sp. NPDC050801]|uniref:AvrD family protein n=1 Tax=unclassified Actinosynnema TaxID=2637065 RepID=UPI0033DCB2E8
MTNQILQRVTVDDYLGDGAKRFFATGYRRVGYTFDPVTVAVRGAADATVGTTVGLTYPADWSKKAAGTDLRPHLSTIDAILLGVQLAELCLVTAFRPDPAAHRAMWVRRVKIRAGQRPEEDLDALPLGARLRGTESGTGGTVSVVDSQVGAMRVRCEVVHAGGEVHTGQSTLSGPDDVLGPAEGRYYGSGFASAEHRIDALTVDGLRAAGTVRLAQASANQGIEGAYHPAPTMVDAFATGLQLAQILLYELDSMRRGDSNTLWMRSTTLDVVHPRRPMADALPLVTTLTNTDLIDMDGGRWRTADIVTDLAGITFTCAVAHALPSAN